MNKFTVIVLLFLSSCLCLGQEKETIYLDYDSLKVVEGFEYEQEKGIAFSSWGIHLLYNYNDDIILISKESVNKIKTLTFKEIQKKQGELSYKKFKKYVWGDRNSYFNTYVIRLKENGSASLYPVVWINEGLQM